MTLRAKGKRVLIRCDASPSIGAGHLMRCDALACALQKEGMSVCMLGPSSSYRSICQARYDSWNECAWQGEEVEALMLARLQAEQRFDLLVVDDYRAAENFQLRLAAAGGRWLQFYAPGSAELHADIALCSNPAVDDAHFAGRIRRAGCRLLVGLDYALLREEFVGGAAPRVRRSLEHLLLTFGGGDDRGLIAEALRELDHESLAGLRVTVIAGRANPRNEVNLQALCNQRYLDAYYRIQPNGISETMRTSDLSILAGGTTSYEAARCGLPMLLVSIADNQVEQSEAMQRLGCALYLGRAGAVRPGALLESVLSLKAHPQRLGHMSECAASAVDGLGGTRVTEAILSVLS